MIARGLLLLAVLALLAGSADARSFAWARGGTPPVGVTCALNPGPSPNACPDNTNPSPGQTIHVTVVGTSLTPTAALLTLNYNSMNNGGYGAVPISGDGVYAFTIPRAGSDRPQPVLTQLDDSGLGFVANGTAFTIAPSYVQPLGNALPASVAADPFVPAHTLTVCPSGCGYTSPADAISFAQSNSWDNVLVTVQVADYDHEILPGAFISPDTTLVAHLWVKGIIGSSGTDGTVFPHLYGIDHTGGGLLQCTGPGQLTVDNIEFGPWFGGWLARGLNCGLTTLRNVYIRDALQGIITGDNYNCGLNIYNSQLARAGGGGQEHVLYFGAGNLTSPLTIKNSIIQQATGQGHDVKTRSYLTTIDNTMILLNIDPIYNGSEVIDQSTGYVLHLSHSLLVNGDMGNDTWSNSNSFDILRYASDNNPITPLPNAFEDVQNNVFVSDGGTFRQFILLWQPMMPSPPYPAAGNTFVFRNAAQYNNGTSGGTVFQMQNGGGSAVVTSTTSHNAATNAFDINLGTLGTTNFVFQDRASAGYPPVTGSGAYPQTLGNTSPAYAISTGVGLDWRGMVKVPPN
jgi:hypothetical protein